MVHKIQFFNSFYILKTITHTRDFMVFKKLLRNDTVYFSYSCSKVHPAGEVHHSLNLPKRSEQAKPRLRHQAPGTT